MIDFTKPIQTRDGRPVRILCTDGRRPGYPVIGYKGDDAFITTWKKNGSYVDKNKSDPHDLVNVPETVDLNRPIKTRDGRSVRILCTDGPNPTFPVVGFIEGDERSHGWRLDGRWEFGFGDTINTRDLVNISTTVPSTFYFNIYKEEDGRYSTRGSHCSRESADNYSNPGRVSCQKVTINVTPGQFDP